MQCYCDHVRKTDLNIAPFTELRENGAYYVDKTLLMRDILEDNSHGVYMFIRPPGFGKTVNISMLDAFFNREYQGNTWFEGLGISDCPEYAHYKNAFPVIRLNLKDAGTASYESYIDGVRKAVRNAYRPHRHILERSDLDAVVRRNFESLDRMDIDEDSLSSSIKNLSGAITEIIGTKPVILIDDYDTPAIYSYGKGIHKDVLRFLNCFLETSLKTNGDRQMAFLTGNMRIAGSSTSSCLDNVTVNNVFSKRADDKFGFTESEVELILSDFGLLDRISEARDWYGGYHLGNIDAFAPYGIMNYLKGENRPRPYRTDSRIYEIVGELLKNLDEETCADILRLVAGGSIVTGLTDRLPYEKPPISEETLYSLLTMSGYLKAIPLGEDDFTLSLPNRTTKDVLERIARK